MHCRMRGSRYGSDALQVKEVRSTEACIGWLPRAEQTTGCCRRRRRRRHTSGRRWRQCRRSTSISSPLPWTCHVEALLRRDDRERSTASRTGSTSGRAWVCVTPAPIFHVAQILSGFPRQATCPAKIFVQNRVRVAGIPPPLLLSVSVSVSLELVAKSL